MDQIYDLLFEDSDVEFDNEATQEDHQEDGYNSQSEDEDHEVLQPFRHH